ncbi:MAG: Chaperone of endosialidase [Firmicutes bacterium]|nr:Chaperone of endosialidase [Bacillota bacterium]
MAFSGMALTEKGTALQAKVQSGGTLVFTKLSFGKGILSSDITLASLTELIDAQMTVEIESAVVLSDNDCRVRGTLTNASLTTGFFVREIGLFATDPDTGEILYAVANAGDECDFLPASSLAAVEQVVDVVISIGSATNVTVTLDESAVLATKTEITSLNNINYESTGYGIIVGLAVSAQATADMTVAIDEGVAHMPSGQRFQIDAISSQTIDTADSTNHRIDIIYVSSCGKVVYKPGTAASSPAAPALPEGALTLAELLVTASTTTITSDDITDKRTMKINLQSLTDYTGTAKLADIKTLGPWADIRAYGAAGDGSTDDLSAYKALRSRAFAAADNVLTEATWTQATISTGIGSAVTIKTNTTRLYTTVAVSPSTTYMTSLDAGYMLIVELDSSGVCTEIHSFSSSAINFTTKATTTQAVVVIKVDDTTTITVSTTVNPVIKAPNAVAYLPGPATYYFAGTRPDLTGCHIYADHDVVIQVDENPNIKDMHFLTPVTIYNSGHGTTFTKSANVNVPWELYNLGTAASFIAEQEFKCIDMTTLTTSAITSVNTYGAFTGTVTANEIAWSTAFNSGQEGVLFNPEVGNSYEVTFSAGTVTSNGFVSAVIMTATQRYDFALYGNTAGLTMVFQSNDSSTSDIATTIYKLPNGYAYSLYSSGSVSMKLRSVDTDMVEVYVNEYKVGCFELSSDITTAGFAVSYHIAGVVTINNFIEYTKDNFQAARPLSIGIVGDSISYGAWATIPYDAMLKAIAQNMPGIGKVSVTNYAISSTSAVSWAASIESYEFSSHDYVLVMLGTNDVQGAVSDSTFETDLTTIANKIVADGSVPIIGVFPVYTEAAVSGITGVTTSYYTQGALKRSIIKRMCAANGYEMADVQDCFGSNLGWYNDNIHPTAEGFVAVAKAFAYALCRAERPKPVKVSSLNALTVSGNTTLGGTLTVAGATALASTLSVAGSTTLSGSLAPDGGILSDTYSSIKIGTNALASSTGYYNAGVGHSALSGNATGESGVAVGYQALYSNTTGSYNTGVGRRAACANSTGSYNTAIGSGALASDLRNYNTAVGYQAQANMVSASGYNTALGYQALLGNSDLTSSTGSYNTAIGTSSLVADTTGSFNTALGYLAGKTITTGTYNTAIGCNAGASIGTYTNCTALGYSADITASNQVQLGNSSTTVYYYSLASRSDRRDKTDIADTSLGLEFINKLIPRQFRWNYRDDYPSVDENDGSKTRTRYHQGIIAQELKTVMNDLGIDFAGYQDHSVCGGEDVLSINYLELIGPMIKAIQELSATVTAQAATIKILETTVAGLTTATN